MSFLDHRTILQLAKEAPRPLNPARTVSAFSSWVYNLYRPSNFQSMREGKLGEYEIERERRDLRRPEPWSRAELLFADPLDRSCPPKRMSSLLLGSSPIYGIPDAVFRDKQSGTVFIFERKITTARPKAWPNLKVQLWCYSRIDEWKDAEEIVLIGHIYNPKYELERQIPVPVGNWLRGEKSFESECRDLFECFGGKVIGGNE